MASSKNLKYQIVFDSIPSSFVSRVSAQSKNKKTGIKNLFYCIYGFCIKNTKEYVVVDQIFKKVTSRKEKNFYFEKIDENITLFNDKIKVMKYISEYLWNFNEHERISNIMVENKLELNESELASILEVWFSKIKEYYTSIEQLTELNNLAKKTLKP